MSTDYKKQFNILTTEILRKVVDACPKQVDLSAKTYGIDTESVDVSRIAADLRKAKSKAEFLKATIEWLVAEGFIRAGSEPDHYIATFHCLKLKGCVPDALTK